MAEKDECQGCNKGTFIEEGLKTPLCSKCGKEVNK